MTVAHSGRLAGERAPDFVALSSSPALADGYYAPCEPVAQRARSHVRVASVPARVREQLGRAREALDAPPRC